MKSIQITDKRMCTCFSIAIRLIVTCCRTEKYALAFSLNVNLSSPHPLCLSVCIRVCLSNEWKKDNSYIIIWYALFVCDPIYQIAYQRRIDRRNGEIKLIELNTSTKSSFEYRRENCSNRSFIMSIVKFPLILSLHRISQEEFKSFDSKENML